MKGNIKKIFFSREAIVILIIINILTVIAAFKPEFLQSLETSVYDFGINRNNQLSSTTDKISIITIDKESTIRLGPWPWDRTIISELLNILSNAKAKTIGLQFPLAGAKNNLNLNSLQQLKNYIRENKKSIKRKQRRELLNLLNKTEQQFNTDEMLSKSIFKAPNLILTMQPDHSTAYLKLESNSSLPDFMKKSLIRGKKPTNTVETIPALLFPLKSFGLNARGIGVNTLIKNHGDIVLNHPLVLRYKKYYFPSFSLALAARSLAIPLSAIRITKSGIKFGSRNIRTNSTKQLYPAFLPENKLTSVFKHYPFYKVLNGDVPAQTFRNKTVIIGLTDINSSNRYITTRGRMSAPFVSANIITSLIDKNYFTQPAWANTVESILVICVLLYLFFIVPHFATTISIVITLFLTTLLVASSQYFLIAEHLWLKTATIAFILFFGHLIYALYHAISSSKRKFLIESAESIRMLVTALQSQGQIDMAMDKLRSIPKIDSSVLGLAYAIAQDYESKRQYGKAISVYDFILNHDKKFRDTTNRKKRAENVDNAVILKSSGSIVADGIDTMPKLGHYEVEKEIGRGAMGVVYLGHDSKINRTVAIKTLALSDEFTGQDLKDVTKRFFREAEVVGKLNHPNIVTVYDAGQEHDLTYMAMEYLKGKDLTHYIQAKNKPKLDWVLDIIWYIAGALDYAHKQGVVHRDIKPANIMYLTDGTVKITDFGIARVTDSSTTKTGTALGTPSYMSPEQISGEKVKGTSDFFSLGITMYELLTGELPFQGDSLAAIIYQITTKRHKPITQLRKRLPPCIKTIVDKLLQKEIKNRYQDGESIQAAIERCMKR